MWGGARSSGGAPGYPDRWVAHDLTHIRQTARTMAKEYRDAGRASFWAESAREIDGVIHFEFTNGVRYAARILERDEPSVFAVEYFGGEARFELWDDGYVDQ